MRFLLFNIVVGAALVYLLFGGPAAFNHQIGLPQDAVSADDHLSQKSERTLAEDAVKAPPPVSPSQASDVAQVKPEPVIKSISKSVTKAPAPKAPPPINKVKCVPTLPIHGTPAPKRKIVFGSKDGEHTSQSQQLPQRRAEVLGEGKAKVKFAVKDGASMMSPGERYRELSKLVDDMEVVYFNSLSD